MAFQGIEKLRTLFRLESSGLSLPEFVKNADASELEVYNEEGIPLTKAAAFADAVHAAFGQKPDRLTARRIALGLRLHGIERETVSFLKQAKEKIEDTQRPAIAGYLGPGKSFPYAKLSDLTKAASYLVEHADRIPLRVRRVVARNILKKAEDFPDIVPPEIRAEIETMAGFGAGSTRSAAREIMKRACYLKQKGINRRLADRLEKLAVSVIDAGVRAGTEEAMKIEEAIDDIDRVYFKHASGMRPAWQIFHAISPTAVDMAEQKIVKVGQLVTLSRDRLNLLDLRTVSRLFGAKSARAIRTGLKVDPDKAARWAESLNPEQANLLLRILSERERQESTK